jgi:ParB family chromosome partitioning protein
MSSRKPLKGQTRLATRGQAKLDDHPAVTTYDEGEIKNIPVADIKPNPDQPRKNLNRESLSELSQSIKDVGLLQPIIVKILDDGSVQLVAGQRRLEAIKMAGLEEIRAIITKGDSALIALIENVQREDLNPIEEAEAFSQLIDRHGYNQDQLAQVIGKAKSSVSETLSINRLPKEIKDEVRRGELFPKRMLREIVRQKNEKSMLALFNKAKKLGLKSDQVKDLIKDRKVRTPAAVNAERLKICNAGLKKLALDTIEDNERDDFINTCKSLRGALDDILTRLE